MKRILIIIEQVDPIPTAAAFRVVEKIQTVDGYRDRLTWNSFATLSEAQEFVKVKGESE